MVVEVTNDLDRTPRPNLHEALARWPNAKLIERDGRAFVLMGTAHVSKVSVREVREAIEALHPDAVCVELCQSRFESMRDEARWRSIDIFQVFREGKTLFLLANLAVGAYQRRLGEALGVRPGAELLEAIAVAEELGVPFALVDRDVHITLRRTWANLGLWERSQLLVAVLASLVARVGTGSRTSRPAEVIDAQAIEALKDPANLSEMMKEFAKALPAVKVPLIDERDLFLAARIRATPGALVLAAVGAAHVPGIVSHFDDLIDLDALSQPPKPKWYAGLLRWSVPVILAATFFLGLSQTDGRSLSELALAWVLPTSLFSALGVILTGGRPLSILAALVSSPITTIHPLIASGMIVGPAEAWARKPTVADAERIHKDAQSVRGFFRNPFTRTLIVALGASLGSAIGAWVGLTWVISIVA